jgi:hypothetical protein
MALVNDDYVDGEGDINDYLEQIGNLTNNQLSLLSTLQEVRYLDFLVTCSCLLTASYIFLLSRQVSEQVQCFEDRKRSIPNK